MADAVSLVNPKSIKPNSENLRIIFREDELESLADSIKEQGILVPLTVFKDNKKFVILDGERRWRCALRLSLGRVPIIVQPKPDKLQNIMMMFAIHKARSDWDPLPTAVKLGDLERTLTQRHGHAPTEAALAAAASLSRGEVRRYRQILALPDKYKKILMGELKKPRHEQVIKVDHILEATRGADALFKKDIISSAEKPKLVDAIIKKFRSNDEKNTTGPRKLPKIARGVEKGTISPAVARRAVEKIITKPDYTTENAFHEVAAESESIRSLELQVTRLIERIEDHLRQKFSISDEVNSDLSRLKKLIQKLIG